MMVHPCGMAVDYLRSAYRAHMRMYPGGPLVPVVWFRCAPGARPFPGWSAFLSRNWEDPHHNEGVGEQRPFDDVECPRKWQPWYNGRPPVPYDGLSYCGALETWERGGIEGVTPQFTTDDRGYAACCGPTLWYWAGRGGAMAGGAAPAVAVAARPYTPSGGALAGGDALYEAVYDTTYAYAGEGGSWAGGEAAYAAITDHVYTPAGGALAGGAAAHEEAVVLSYEGGGGAIAGGAAGYVVSPVYEYGGLGGAVGGGAAAHEAVTGVPFCGCPNNSFILWLVITPGDAGCECAETVVELHWDFDHYETLSDPTICGLTGGMALTCGGEAGPLLAWGGLTEPSAASDSWSCFPFTAAYLDRPLSICGGTVDIEITDDPP